MGRERRSGKGKGSKGGGRLANTKYEIRCLAASVLMWAWPAGALKSLIIKAKFHKALNANASYEQQTMWQLPQRGERERERCSVLGLMAFGCSAACWIVLYACFASAKCRRRRCRCRCQCSVIFHVKCAVKCFPLSLSARCQRQISAELSEFFPYKTVNLMPRAGKAAMHVCIYV